MKVYHGRAIWSLFVIMLSIVGSDKVCTTGVKERIVLDTSEKRHPSAPTYLDAAYVNASRGSRHRAARRRKFDEERETVAPRRKVYVDYLQTDVSTSGDSAPWYACRSNIPSTKQELLTIFKKELPVLCVEDLSTVDYDTNGLEVYEEESGRLLCIACCEVANDLTYEEKFYLMRSEKHGPAMKRAGATSVHACMIQKVVIIDRSVCFRSTPARRLTSLLWILRNCWVS